MDVEETIRTRRSIRRFAPEAVGEKDREALLDAGRWAPSGLNNQPWKLVLVEDRGKAAELASCTSYSSIVNGAALLVAVFLDEEVSYDRDKDIMAIGAFIQNLLLTAHARGLGAVWLGEILKQKEKAREVLEVPPQDELMAVIAIGRPAEQPKEGSRKPLDDIILKEF
jgi:nitroreductase